MNVLYFPLLFGTLAQLSAASDVRPIPVTGVVADGAGRPIRDAEIWLTRATRVEEDRKSGMELSWAATQAEDEETPEHLVTRTDAAGCFRLEVPAEFTARSDPVALAVWAVHGDGAVAVEHLPRVLRSDDPPLRLNIGPAVQTELALAGPDGQPIAEARVVPTRVMEMPVRHALGRRFAGMSDRQGRFALLGLSRGAVGEVRVETPRMGIQRIALAGNGTTTIALAPVGQVAGRLIAPADFTQPITGVNVRVRSKVGGFEGSGIAGETEAACDPSGRFEIPAIAAGILEFELVFDREQGVPLRGEAPRGLVLSAGSKLELTIPLRPTVLIRGVVREKETTRPIAGVRLVINNRFGGDRFAVSDSQGNYSARVVREANQAFGWPIRIPRPFYQPDGAPEVPQSMPPRDRAELLLPPLELSRGVDLPGVVLDEAGKPVADAEVEAIYGQAILTRTDPQGCFVLSGLDPLRELKIEARRGDASSGRTAIVRAGNIATSHLSLTIRRGRISRLGGRVVDRSGRPVGGASVRIWRQIRQEGGSFLKEPVAGEDGSIVLRTGADGRFHTTRPLPLGDEYVVDAAAPARFPVRTEAHTLTGGDQSAPDIVLPGVRTVAGQVVDRPGQPLAGVRVFQSGDGPLRTEAKTDADGQFRLPGVIEGPAFVFASTDGYRFDVQTIDLESTPIRLTLARNEEPPARTYKTLDSPLPVEEEKALARRLFLPYAERVLAHGSDPQKFRLVMNGVHVDPSVVLEKLETTKVTDPDYLNLARVQIVEGLATDSLDEALAQAELCTSADARALCYLEICDLRPDLDKTRVRDLIDQALLNARAVKSPDYRLTMYGQIADKLLDLGEKERARKLLAEAEALGGSAVRGNVVSFNLGIVAQALARVDLPAALKMLDYLSQQVQKNDKRDRTYVFVRFYGTMAHKLAADAPADAERLLEKIQGLEPAHASRYAIAVCSKMVRTDPARARRIAESMSDTASIELKPYALGLIAQKLTATDKAGAEETAQLAMMIGRYDRDLAARLLRPPLEQLGTLRSLTTQDYITFRVLAALASIDPHQAVERIEKLPDDPAPGLEEYTPKNSARIHVARLLAAHGKERWKYIYEYFLSLWTPEQRYL
jgi:protocatechuate 3,4-dioxygenase beta subunit